MTLRWTKTLAKDDLGRIRDEADVGADREPNDERCRIERGAFDRSNRHAHPRAGDLPSAPPFAAPDERLSCFRGEVFDRAPVVDDPEAVSECALRASVPEGGVHEILREHGAPRRRDFEVRLKHDPARGDEPSKAQGWVDILARPAVERRERREHRAEAIIQPKPGAPCRLAPMIVSHANLAALDRRLDTLAPVEILRIASEALGPRLAILSSMQRAGTVLCHMADSLRRAEPIDVLFVDTGVLHQETLATRDALVRVSPNLRVLTLHPAMSFAEQTRARGVLYLTKEGQEACCDLRKSKPLEAVRGSYQVFISALRRSEGGKRGKVPLVAHDPAMNALRLHPLANATDADLDAYEAAHTLHPVVNNPLHGWGFPTIGCFPCTTPVREDEDTRAGRWRHLADVAYCGINPTDRAGDQADSSGVDVGVTNGGDPGVADAALARFFDLAGLDLKAV